MSETDPLNPKRLDFVIQSGLTLHQFQLKLLLSGTLFSHLLPIQCHNQIFIRSTALAVYITIIRKEPILQRMPVFGTRVNKVHIYKQNANCSNLGLGVWKFYLSCRKFRGCRNLQGGTSELVHTNFGQMHPKLEGGGALCFEWSFTRTFPRNQNVAINKSLMSFMSNFGSF